MNSAISQEQTSVSGLAQRARLAARVLATLTETQRNQILHAAADAIEARREEILAANEKDCAAAWPEVAAGRMAQSLFARLQTGEKGVADMANKVRQVAALPDPIRQTLAVTELDDGLTLRKVSCPLGVIGVIFESRPDVIPQIGALTLKSGNATLLKGGREAAQTNAVLRDIWHTALAQRAAPPDAVQLLQTREDVAEMLRLHGLIDLIIPRGSKEFVARIMETSAIPVIGHGEGVCHVYVDAAADLQKAWAVTLDAKTNYPAACNAAETLLVHEALAADFLPEMVKRLRAAGVETRGCERTQTIVNDVVAAVEGDWATEYGDLIISVRVVKDFDEAIAHISRYGSQHTETIATEDADAAERFMELVDAAGVYHNASTRFADGFRYGFGAEIGISNAKLHARGPVGLEGLTTYKYKLYGNGQTVASYNAGERTFKHRKLL
jgi:glutamate-5-semialdehyde dehydrogenase